MKIFAILILTSFITTGFFGQTIDKLDEKNGFKDFKLGDSYSKWQNELIFNKYFDDGSKLYKYTGSCCNKVFNYFIDLIELQFSNDKLVAIFITTEKFQKSKSVSGELTTWRKDDWESIKNSFSYLFGPPTSVEMADGSGPDYSWDGKKVSLLSCYEYLGYNAGDRQLIIVASISYLYKNIEDGF